MSSGLTAKLRGMGDPRHKRPYPKGDRKEMTQEWKTRVRDRLAENKRTGTYPRDQVELADAVGAADKSAITKMMKAKSSKLVPAICKVLQIPMPMQARRDADDLDRILDGADAEKRQQIAALIRASNL